MEEERREDYVLNVDLSSAGCRSKEQLWQAEHRIHQSLLSMPSCSFSEVEENGGAWLQARREWICFQCERVCVFGGGEVWAHAQCLKARIWHFENVTKIPETESVMSRRECSGSVGLLNYRPNCSL